MWQRRGFSRLRELPAEERWRRWVDPAFRQQKAVVFGDTGGLSLWSFIERVQIVHAERGKGLGCRWEDVGLGNLGLLKAEIVFSNKKKTLKYSTSLYAPLVELNES